MSLLLDTNAFLWWVSDSPRLATGAREAITAEDVWISSATAFEIATKRNSGKLRFDDDIARQVTKNGFRALDVTSSTRSRQAICLCTTEIRSTGS